jgi:hypothetical protein
MVCQRFDYWSFKEVFLVKAQMLMPRQINRYKRE